MKNIIKYGGLVLVIIGIILVMKNLFATESEWKSTTTENTKSKTQYYHVEFKLIDHETKSFLTGATLKLENESGKTIEQWNSENSVHLINKLKPGKYIIKEVTAPEGYHLNEDGVSFEVKNKDLKTEMYNIKMTQEEMIQQKQKNIIQDEVNVESTSSTKLIFIPLLAILCFLFGIIKISKSKI